MLLAAGREVVSKTSAYNITKLSYRVEVRVRRLLFVMSLFNPGKYTSRPCFHSGHSLIRGMQDF